MSNTTLTKRGLAAAIVDAEAFRSMFPSSCYERWEIAGSVRRRRPEVGDVEHVVIPRFGEVDNTSGLFAMKEQVNLLFHHLDALVRGGHVEKHWYGNGFRWGEKFRGVDFRGVNHEVHCVDQDNFGAILTIATGPAEFSERLVTIMKGRGVYRQQDGYVVAQISGRRVPCRDEEHYFELCGLKWIRPEDRR